MCVCILSCVHLFVTPWTVVHQAPLAMEFSRQEYWSRLSFSTPGDLPDPGIKPASLVPPALAGGFFTTVPPGKPYQIYSLQIHFFSFYSYSTLPFFFFFAVQSFIVDMFSHVYFWFCWLCFRCHTKKIIIKTHVKDFFPYFFPLGIL